MISQTIITAVDGIGSTLYYKLILNFPLSVGMLSVCKVVHKQYLVDTIYTAKFVKGWTPPLFLPSLVVSTSYMTPPDTPEL